MRQRTILTEEAQAIAMAGLAMLADQPERMARFLAVSGVEPAQIRGLAETADFQAAILGHIRSDESLLLVFVAQLGIEPIRVSEAEASLGGKPAQTSS